jgi:hypothetical protein
MPPVGEVRSWSVPSLIRRAEVRRFFSMQGANGVTDITSSWKKNWD